MQASAADTAGRAASWRLLPDWQSKVEAVASSISKLLNTAGTQVDRLTVHMRLPDDQSADTPAGQTERATATQATPRNDAHCSCVRAQVAQLRFVDCSAPQPEPAATDAAEAARCSCQDVEKSLTWKGLTVHISQRCSCSVGCGADQTSESARGAGDDAAQDAPCEPAALQQCQPTSAGSSHEHGSPLDETSAEDDDDAFFPCEEPAPADVASEQDAAAASPDADAAPARTADWQHAGVLVLTGTDASEGFSGRAELSLRFEGTAAQAPRITRAGAKVSSGGGVTVPLATATLPTVFAVVQRLRATVSSVLASREQPAAPLTASVLAALRPAQGLQEVAELTAEDEGGCACLQTLLCCISCAAALLRICCAGICESVWQC